MSGAGVRIVRAARGVCVLAADAGAATPRSASRRCGIAGCGFCVHRNCFPAICSFDIYFPSSALFCRSLTFLVLLLMNDDMQNLSFGGGFGLFRYRYDMASVISICLCTFSLSCFWRSFLLADSIVLCILCFKPFVLCFAICFLRAVVRVWRCALHVLLDVCLNGLVELLVASQLSFHSITANSLIDS